MVETEARRNRFTLIDGVALIAAIALGLAGYRGAIAMGWTDPWSDLLSRPPRGWTPMTRFFRVLEWQVPTMPFAVPCTLALPVLRLARRPRPRRRALVRQPGMAACVAAVLGWAWSTIPPAVMLVYARSQSPPAAPDLSTWMAHYLPMMFPPIGLAVAMAWAWLALSGRWGPVPDWIDRAGRALGVYWIVIGLEWGCIPYYVFL